MRTASKTRRALALDRAVYLIVRAMLCVVQSLSLAQLSSFAGFAGWVIGDVVGIRRQVVDDNLRHAFPKLSQSDRRRIQHDMWRHLFTLLCEMAMAQRKIHRTNWRQYVRLEGAEEVVARMLSTTPTVVVTAHFGNFELSGYMAGLFGFPTYTMARPLDNPYLDNFLRRFRQRTGQVLIDSSGTAELAQAVLSSGDTLAILGDHHAGKKGCWVEFFGRPASCHKSIALFSLANRLPLMVLVTTRRKSLMQFEMKCVDVFDLQEKSADRPGVPELTQWYNRRLEAEIRVKPAQYWWIHRRWKGRDQGRKKKDAT